MIADIRLHPAGLPEAPVVAALQQSCFPDEPWDTASVATLIGQPGCFAVLAQRGPDPVGFVLARVAAEDAEILAIGVLPEGRRGGIGRLLVESSLAAAGRLGATAMFLEVAEDNDGARTLYASCGFQPVGRRPGYYRRADGGVAALVLRHAVQPAASPSP